MGITGLWDVLGDGEVHRIEDYAAAHFQEHKRPLRIAVDEACWRFNNLTDEQVQRIQEGEPAANPIEKTILWRILKFWRLNIQLLFVTDGMRRIGKDRWASKGSGRGGGKIDPKCIKMLHQMFDRLKVPYHRAPGEAEAECALLQQQGIVDAVWSDDSDCLMFGCTKLIKAHRNSSGKKEWLDRIAVYDARTVLPRYDLNTDGLVMFAVLAGGDYDTKGLPGCGFQTARGLCKTQRGLAEALRRCTDQRSLSQWRDVLATALAAKHSVISVPPDFPSLKALNGYRHPAVSTFEQCNNMRRLSGEWERQERQMDQTMLRVVLRDHYNFKTKEWMHHMAPVFLTRMLTRGVTPARREENLAYGVQLRRTLKRKPTNDEDDGVRSEVNILFNAAQLVDIDLSFQDSVNADGSPYDPMEPVKGVVLKCFLDHGLPEGALDKPAPSPKKKRKKADKSTEVVDIDGDDATPSASQGAPTSTPQSTSPSKVRRQASASQRDADEADFAGSQPPKAAKKRTRKNDNEAGPSTAKKPRKSKAAVAAAPSPPPPELKRVAMPDFESLRKTAHDIIDLDEDSECNADPSTTSSGHVVSSYRPLPAPRQCAEPNPFMYPEPRKRSSDTRGSPVARSSVPTKSSKTNAAIPPPTRGDTLEETVPGEVAIAATLRQRRELGLLSKLPMRSSEDVPRSKPAQQQHHEVIDLT